ncbi:dolichyl-p-man:man c -pp-dolichyl mannosyltransferase [Zalerion maritima]|uniref:Dol-P-Man:Man(5)GlcNAc(2)-PP-Dol alpha-1,3-mannosyltransferase n=1 Tax=Zalerion maritima TaxID=339359 RepID=A0AAD5RK54_9PEZI|nr:dolichyl-p-man:man c -pp-dolichyl mannosyltransferase [Zalerion maritima]
MAPQTQTAAMARESTISIYWRAVIEAFEMLLPGLPPLLLCLDAILCALIIVKVPYTEIDWVAYMQQVKQFINGETDYTQISGDTGPLVYPGAHVYTYTALYYITDEGSNIARAQLIFAMLYVATLALVLGCYWQAKAPAYTYPLLCLSKRLHSIFVLRCFNDCFAVFFLFLAILLFQRRLYTLGAFAYSWGVGIKMSLLLSFPGIAIVLFLGRGFHGSLRVVWLMAQLQMAIGVPFLKTNWRGYLGRAFELSRVFLFKWTVNWRFVGEDVFLSKNFAYGLLGLHALVLAAFGLTKWLKPAKKPVSSIVGKVLKFQQPLTDREEILISKSVSPRFVLTTVLTSNVVGLLFARSLHYQFYAYLAWATPFLLWRSGIHPVLQYVLWGIQELVWNVYPSTEISSGAVVGLLALQVLLVYLGAREEWEEVPHGEEKPEEAKR